MEKQQIDRHIFICELCGSVFAVNSGHPRIQNGDWMRTLKDTKDCTGAVRLYLDCPACGSCMLRPDDFVKSLSQ